MSKLLTAGLYIADSKQPNLLSSMYILANLIEDILDGKYQDPTTHTEILHFKKDAPPIKVSIIGISIGDDTIEILGKGDIEKCMGGIRGRIMILCILDNQMIGVDLSQVANISEERVIKSSPPILPPQPLGETVILLPIVSDNHRDAPSMSMH